MPELWRLIAISIRERTRGSCAEHPEVDSLPQAALPQASRVGIRLPSPQCGVQPSGGGPRAWRLASVRQGVCDSGGRTPRGARGVCEESACVSCP